MASTACSLVQVSTYQTTGVMFAGVCTAESIYGGGRSLYAHLRDKLVAGTQSHLTTQTSVSNEMRCNTKRPECVKVVNSQTSNYFRCYFNTFPSNFLNSSYHCYFYLFSLSSRLWELLFLEGRQKDAYGKRKENPPPRPPPPWTVHYFRFSPFSVDLTER